MREFKGTIILVSHEHLNSIKIGLRIFWNIEDWTTKIVLGGPMNQRAKGRDKAHFRGLYLLILEAPELEKTPSRVTELYSELFSGVGFDTKSAWGRNV